MTLTPGIDQTPGQTCTFSENMTDGLVLTEYGNYTVSNGVTISETSGVAMRITQTSATGTSNVQIDGSLIGSSSALRSTGDAHVTVGQDGLLQSTGSSYALEITGDTESSLTLEGNINSVGDGLEIIADTVALNLTNTSDITVGDDAIRIEATSVTAQLDGTIAANGNAIIIGAGSVTVGAAAVIDLGEGAFQMGGAGDGVVTLDGFITAEDMLILYDGINDVTISGTIVLTEIGADGIIIGDPNNPNSSSTVNFTGSITSVNDGLQILANATVFASGTINAVNDTAISMSSGGSLDFTGAIESSMFGIIGNANLDISGTISSSFYAVFNSFDTYLASSSIINVDGTNGFEAGIVQGYNGTNTSSITALGQITSSGDGIFIFGADTEAFVGGSIIADNSGIIIQQSDLSNGTTNLTFNGTMSAGLSGIVINANTVANINGSIVSGGTALDIGTGIVDITVTGTVIGAEYAVDARGFGLDLTLVNLGTLDGDIILSDDDDYFDNSLGNIGAGHTIDIGEGDDQFIGGSGDEYVIMSGGNNIVSGGDGTDTLDYSQAAANINANLATGSITQTQPYISSFFSEFDMPLTDVIDALMAGTLYINLSTTDFPTGALRLQLDMPTSDITGEFGDRTITFDDILLIPINGAPDQSVRAYITFSEFFGDWSIDIELSVDDLPLTSITNLEFREGLMGETGPILLDILNDPNTDVDTFTLADQVSTFENVIGTDFDDVIIGNDEDNIFSGLGGDDILNGGAGRDTLDGGLGADQMTGGTGNDTYFVDNAGDVIIEEAGEGYENVNVTLNAFFLTIGDNLERVNFQGTGNFVSRGNELNNRFTGAAGNDKFLLDSGGADIFSGGQGRDAFDARSSTIGIQLHLEDQSLNAGDVAGDIFASMESFFGSNTAGDYMQTGAARARFSGFGGDDTLIGGNSVDFLQGGADNDTLDGGAARDTLQGGTGNDMMTGGADRDQFLFVETNFGQDTITDYEDGLDYLKIFSAVADDISDFIITGNGTDTVTLTLDDGTGNNVLTLESGDGSVIDITAADFQFYG